MLSNFDSLERPPQPPPKQRNLETNKIDTRTVFNNDQPQNSVQESNVDIAAEFNKINLNLFEPPGGANNNKAEPQKFKKGNLKLTQDEKGNWKIEENLENVPLETQVSRVENNNKVVKKSSPKSKKSGKSEASPESALLRRPSIKKIKAFFQQQKEASADLVSEAVSKLPTLGNLESKSVPSSLDRKFLDLKHPPKPQGPRQPLKSVSSESLQKPSLPIKRSKCSI